MPLTDLAYSAAGLVILLIAGDLLVRGAVSLSLRLQIPAIIISLTVVAFGTSAPELLIVTQAALEGLPGLALGNVIGSNIANVLLVLGVPALIFGLQTAACDTRMSYMQVVAVSVVFIALCFLGPLHYAHGTVLLAMLVAMLGHAAWSASRARSSALAEEIDVDEADMPMPKTLTLLVLGLIGLPVGAHLLIEGATGVARELGVSDAVIGLTLVALGTSLPELATTVMAAMRRQADVAIGNVLGSNMFNLAGILGVGAFFAPLPLSPEMLRVDIWVMLAATLILIPFTLFRASMTRPVGLAFVAAYVIYIWMLF
ncbi:calcium/sodium antiporter [Halovulum sp. GXIMD14793]